MKVLFDTNVVLDILFAREPFYISAARLVEKIVRGEMIGYLCATTITTIYYLASKSKSIKQAEHEIQKLLSIFDIAPVNRGVLENALHLKFSDFEDAVIYEAGFQIGVEAIVSRDKKGFKKSTRVPIYEPMELFKAFDKVII